MSITVRQAAFLILLLVPVFKIAMLTPTLFELAGRDGWISIVIFLLIELLVLGFAIMIVRAGGLEAVLDKRIGVIGKKIIMSILAVFFLLQIMLYSVEIFDYVTDRLFEGYNWLPIAIPLVAAGIFIAGRGVNVFGRLADIFIWVFAGILVFSIVFSNADIDFGAIKPILAGGHDEMIMSGAKSALWFADFLPFMFIKIKDIETKKTGWMFAAAAGAIAFVGFIYISYIGLYRESAPIHSDAFASLLGYDSISADLGAADWPGILLWIMLGIIQISFLYYCVFYAVKSIIGEKINAIVSSAVIVVSTALLIYFVDNLQKAYAIAIALWIPCLIVQYVIPLFAWILGLTIRKENEAPGAEGENVVQE